MNYKQTIEYLYNAAPAFTKVGASAYKEGLSNTLALDEHFHHPHQRYATIHVAGTNGKGSCSHTIAAILQASGLRVGLFTSPHLVTFRERIRINGEMIPEQYVVDWVEQNRDFFEPLHPSFFELSTAMAFKYFADEAVDFAVIEVGLGGRLDCTNIINPIISVITNISFDHTQFLGDTLEKIATEKAGIIKPGIPVIIGEAQTATGTGQGDSSRYGERSVRRVFEDRARQLGSPIRFAEDHPILLDCDYDLKGSYQARNRQTVMNALIPLARELKKKGITISDATSKVKYAFENVCGMTGLMGRWHTLSQSPLTICDTGHNVAGWQYLGQQIRATAKNHDSLRIVFGMVDDKDIDTVMDLLPKEATYYFTQASTHRAIPAAKVAGIADRHHLHGQVFLNVKDAYTAALKESSPNDFIFIGGSSYIVADLLTYTA